VRRPRVFIDTPLAAGALVRLPPEAARHLCQVLRLKTDDEVVLFNGRDGRDHRARLLRSDRRAVEAEVLEAGPVEPEPPVAFHLALGLTRGERLDFALQKGTELGATGFELLYTERTQVKWDAQRLERRMAHWRGVIQAACEQSGRRRVPLLKPPQPLPCWLEAHGGPDVVLLDPEAEATLARLAPPQARLAFLTGPEGGLSTRERSAAYGVGCRGARLGPRVLRAETAPLAALAAAQVLWGDLR